jgi:hypothetical protein
MKPKRFLFLFLLVAACGIWTYDFAVAIKRKARPAPATTASIGFAAPEMLQYKPNDADPFFCRDFMPLKNPFNGAIASGRKKPVNQVNLPACSIGGIVYNASNPMAIFIVGGNSQMVKQGDVVDSIVILKIESESMEVSYRGRKFELKR